MRRIATRLLYPSSTKGVYFLSYLRRATLQSHEDTFAIHYEHVILKVIYI